MYSGIGWRDQQPCIGRLDNHISRRIWEHPVPGEGQQQLHSDIKKVIFSHSALTGLPNRVSFEQGLNQGLIQAKRHGWGLAVLFIDIDKFKSINDSYGHDLGDQLLRMVANRLKSFLRDEDTDGDTSDILFKNADAAMYKAKGTEKRILLFRESGERKTG